MPRSDDRKYWPERQRAVSTADWKEEYDGLEEDEAEREAPAIEEVDEGGAERRAQVNMSELLRHAKVKETKLHNGYEYISSPAGKVVTGEEEKAKPADMTLDDWVDLKEDETVPRKEYAKVVAEAIQKSES